MATIHSLRDLRSQLVARWRRFQNYLPGYVKVLYVPAEPIREGQLSRETLWATPLSKGLFRVENVPALAADLNLHDVVRCREAPGQLPVISEVVRRSGNRTLRVRFAEATSANDAVDVIFELRRQGIFYEKIGPGTYLFNVEPSAHYEAMHEYLRARQDEGLLRLEG